MADKLLTPRYYKYYRYIIKEQITVQELVDRPNGVFESFKNDIKALLDYFVELDYGKEGIIKESNSDRIKSMYNENQKRWFDQEYRAGRYGNIIVLPNSFLWVSHSRVTSSLAVQYGENLFIETTDLNYFWAETQKLINDNVDYFPIQGVGGSRLFNTEKFNVIQTEEEVSVKWFTPSDIGYFPRELNGVIQSLSTNSIMGGGGNFQMKLSEVEKIFGIFLGSSVTTKNLEYDARNEPIYNKFIPFSYANDIDSLDTKRSASISTGDKGFLEFPSGDTIVKNNLGFIEGSMGKGDIVFIKFEKLVLEDGEDDLVCSKEGSIKIWDMIGVIDTVSVNYNAESNNYEITVSGRDVMGILEDDASYFYPLAFAKTDKTELNLQDSSNIFKRAVIGENQDGGYDEFFTKERRSIRDSIGFVINTLSNLRIGNWCQIGYYYDKDNNTINTVDSRIGKRRTKKLAITGTSNNVAYNDINREDPVEDSFTAGVANIDYVELQGIWGIVDFVIDPKLENRRIVNNMLVKSEGTLISHMNEICQKPFVEFFGDTYGDKFVFTARQPPFNKQGVRSFLNQQSYITIPPEKVYGFNIEWETEFYSWYEIQYNDNFLGYDKATVLGYIPIAYFSEFAEDYGNSRYLISDSYVSKKALSQKDKDVIVDPQREAILNDLFYVIESTLYLPFTRRGTITIVGDRRIKKGTFIKYEYTNEVFYVEGVSHSYTVNMNAIERVTTLQVSRGMFWENIFDERYNYFNIANIDALKNDYKKLFDYKEKKPNKKVTIGDSKFAFDKYILTDNDKQKLNKQVIPRLKEDPELKISIEGHTDWVGSDEYNIELGLNRAKAVYNYFVEQGIDKGRMRIKTFGESKPIASNETDAGRAQNRRTEVIFIEPKNSSPSDDKYSKSGKKTESSQPILNYDVYIYFRKRAETYVAYTKGAIKQKGRVL
jgi:outer membrane protein OmpA-like peptidoglycan-associated protein